MINMTITIASGILPKIGVGVEKNHESDINSGTWEESTPACAYFNPIKTGDKLPAVLKCCVLLKN